MIILEGWTHDVKMSKWALWWNFMKVSVRHFVQSEGWVLALDSACQAQIQSVGRWDAFINASHTIQWDSQDIAAGNQCVHCCTRRHHIRCNVVATPLINLFLKTAGRQIWKKVISRRVVMKYFLLGSEFYRPVSLLLIVATINLSTVHWAEHSSTSSARER